MTVICYRDGVMAADSRAYAGDKHPIGSKVKIRRLADGTLLGCSTTHVGGGEVVLDWYEKGRKDDDILPEHFTLIAAHKSGELYYLCNGPERSGPLDTPFIAIGSGEAYAHGALEMGATAIEAVRVGIKCDNFSGFPIHEISHRRKTIYEIAK